MAKKHSRKQTGTSPGRKGRGGRGAKTTRKTSSRNGKKGGGKVDAQGKHLVIVESPTKARTINRYLGPQYVVMPSVGHVRDLPKRPPKGVKRSEQPVPGVDLEHDFEPTYEVLPNKKKTVGDLKKAAKQARDVWFATDLDREGEAIAWHLAKALGVEADAARRVVFNAITQSEINRAFEHPRGLDLSRVDAQQARRILDRIVGYQVSPLLWKKVAGGLSAGRVQSVAVRVVVEREREIDAFVPDEYWKITGVFSSDAAATDQLAQQWRAWLAAGGRKAAGGQADGGRNLSTSSRTVKEQNAWLGEHQAIRAELVELDGDPFKADNRDDALAAAESLGFRCTATRQWEDDRAKGDARYLCAYEGQVRAAGEDRPEYRIQAIDTRRTTSRPSAPFITSTLQQAAANRLSFQLQRTMRLAQQLYEGVDLKGKRGQTGLITYMRTDSTQLSRDALSMARGYIGAQLGDEYLPEKPNFYSSSNKAAQEAHEAIRPTDVSLTPQSIKSSLSEEQYKLYDLIWRRFVACQMTPARWDSTTVMIEARPASEGGGGDQKPGNALFKATGRRLAFDGFYKVMGVPGGDDLILPELKERQTLGPMELNPTQHFTSPPPRYTEASLQKKLEQEGIGRPSTYAPIIQTIQDRKYVEPVMPRDRRLMATDLGRVVMDMLMAAFPRIMDVAYTRRMESKLDQIETDREDWRRMLREFYEPFKDNLEHAYEDFTHAKAVTEPAPHTCPECGGGTVYRFGKNGRFLSCARYPDCTYAAPIDREGNPVEPEMTDILCPEDGGRMTRRVGRFGPFLGCVNYPRCKGVVKLDPKKGTIVPPKTPPYETDITCPKCEQAPLNLRSSKRGLWLSCSRFPKCRGRLAWSKLEEDKQQELEKAWADHEKQNPTPVIRTVDGDVMDETYVPKVAGDDAQSDQQEGGDDRFASVEANAA